MAWARKLPSGRYQAQIRDAAGNTVNPFPGQTFGHKAEALRKGGEAETQARTPLHRDARAARMPWAKWCDEHWWPNRHDVEPGVLKRQASDRDLHLRPYWGDVALADITAVAVDAWIAQQKRMISARTGKPLAAATVQRHVHLLSSSLSYAVRAGVLPSNPAARLNVAPVRLVSGDERYLTREEAAALLAEITDPTGLIATAMLLGTGMRFGELAGLHAWRVGKADIAIQETWDDRERRIKAYPKSERQRVVPIAPWLAERIDAHRQTQAPQASCGMPHSGGRCRSGLLIAGQRLGRPLNEGWLRKSVIQPAALKAGIGHVRPHDLRHTYASWLGQDGATLEEIRILLGHHSIIVTERYAKFVRTASATVTASLARDPFAR